MRRSDYLCLFTVTQHCPYKGRSNISQKKRFIHTYSAWYLIIYSKIDLYEDGYTILTSDEIKNVERLHILGINPNNGSSTKQSYLKIWNVMPITKYVSAKRDDVINQQHCTFNEFETQKLLCSQNRYKWTEDECRTLLHVPSGTLWSSRSGTHQVVEIQERDLC